MINPETYTIEPFNEGHDIPADLATLHLGIRRWQEKAGQNSFSNLLESQHDIGALEEYYVAGGGNFFIAHGAHDEAIGFVGLKHDGDSIGSIKRLCVLPDHQRKGVGRALVGETVSWARMHGFKKLKLQTNKGENAKPIYEEFDFKITGFLPERGKYGDWVMELDLQESSQG